MYSADHCEQQSYFQELFDNTDLVPKYLIFDCRAYLCKSLETLQRANGII